MEQDAPSTTFADSTMPTSVEGLGSPSTPSAPLESSPPQGAETTGVSAPASSEPITQEDFEAQAYEAIKKDKLPEFKAAVREPKTAEATDGQPAAKPDHGKAEREKYALAEQALRRDGYDIQTIEDLVKTKGRDFVTNLGLKRKDLQDQQAREFQRANQNKNKPKAESEGQQAEPETPTDAIEPDPGQPEGIDEILADLPPSKQKAVREQLQREQKARQEAEQKAQQTMVLTASQRLTADFPMLKSEDGLRQVLARMDVLDPSAESLGDPAKLEEVMRRAAWAEFGDQIKTTAIRNHRENVERTLDGQPKANVRNGSDSRPLTDAEYEEAAYRAFKKYGTDTQAVNRELSAIKR